MSAAVAIKWLIGRQKHWMKMMKLFLNDSSIFPPPQFTCFSALCVCMRVCIYMYMFCFAWNPFTFILDVLTDLGEERNFHLSERVPRFSSSLIEGIILLQKELSRSYFFSFEVVRQFINFRHSSLNFHFSVIWILEAKSMSLWNSTGKGKLHIA